MTTAERAIELRLHDIEQLFNSLDPSPFREKDIDRDAEDFIVGWAQELPRATPLALRIHLAQPPVATSEAAIVEAVHNYFASRREHAQRELRLLLRQGRLSLLIGLVFLAACLAGGELLAREGAAWAEYVRQSLLIAGWVAMWRPMQIYLYDWWPIRRQIRTFDRLATMPVDISPSPAIHAPPPSPELHA